MGTEFKNSASDIPLLESSSSTGTASTIQTLGNIIVSIVGTGILGLPFAFRVAGWFAGSLGIVIAGISTYYCMLLLVSYCVIFLFLAISHLVLVACMKFCSNDMSIQAFWSFDLYDSPLIYGFLFTFYFPFCFYIVYLFGVWDGMAYYTCSP